MYIIRYIATDHFRGTISLLSQENENGYRNVHGIWQNGSA